MVALNRGAPCYETLQEDRRALRRGTSGNIDGHALPLLQLRGASHGQARAPPRLS
jgi:hypothetical protein